MQYARAVLDAEAAAILQAKRRLNGTFVRAVRLISQCRGRVVTTGIGKPGFIAQKLSATLASVGVPSLYLHPAEAAHGDLGRVTRQDVVIALSNSGATDEVLRLLPAIRRLRARIIALTGDAQSPLAKNADVIIDIGDMKEAGPMALVPTASSAALHAVADALAVSAARALGLSSQQYAFFHPGGRIGKKARLVRELMRSGKANPTVKATETLEQALLTMTSTPGRPGATNVVDGRGRLVGLVTDGDVRRLLSEKRVRLRAPVTEFMTRQPQCVDPMMIVAQAEQLMRELKVDQLPVVDSRGRAVGLLDVQDLLSTH